jgi:hypothetical protein
MQNTNLATAPESLVGKVAKCRHGLVGLITRTSTEHGRTVYKGIFLGHDDKKSFGSAWQSTDPTPLSENQSVALIRNLVNTQRDTMRSFGLV